MSAFDLAALYAHYLAARGHVSTDSRQPQPGTLFFALNGPSFQGADFAAAALDKGARLAVVDDAALAAQQSNYFFAPDPLGALQALAAHHRRRFTGPVLAISGSNGKTTTKELLTAVLAKKFRVLATLGNLNNHIGVPLTLLRLRLDEYDFAVIEMGANHRGEIAAYCQWAAPTHGLLTNIGKAHLEGFGGAEGVALGKGELFDYLKDNGGLAFVNTLDAQVAARAAVVLQRRTYPSLSDDYSVTLLSADPAVSLRLGSTGPDVAARLTGDYNFPNLAAAATVGQFFGVPLDDIATALATYDPQNNRSQLLRTARGNELVLDAYNANPSSMAAALRSFAQRPAAGQGKVVILGDMFELGPEAAAEHHALGELLAGLALPNVVLVGPEMASAKAALGPSAHHFPTKAAAADWLAAQSFTARQMLVKGSRGMALETLVELL